MLKRGLWRIGACGLTATIAILTLASLSWIQSRPANIKEVGEQFPWRQDQAAWPLSSAERLDVQPFGDFLFTGAQEPGASSTKGPWQIAPTPRDGVPWSLLESTQELTRHADGMVYSRPNFPADVRALAGQRITVSGYMMPLEYGPTTQRHFVLLSHPPGCPLHIHAQSNQFIEVYANSPVELNDMNAIVTISGVLELTGEDESGVFYRLRNAQSS